MSKIALTPNNSGTGTLTIAAPNTNTDRTLTLPDLSGSVVLNEGSGTFKIDSSGNLGLGVAPSAWTASFRALQMGSRSAVYQDSSAATAVANNIYNDGTNKYIASAAATVALQEEGAHKWFTAPSGTAGDAITFTQAMTLDAGGRLSIPGQPMFQAGSTTSDITYGSSAIIPFDVKRFDRGNNFNTSTYRFTAPVAGAYFFLMSAYALTGRVALTLYINNSQAAGVGGDVIPYAFKADSATPADMTVGFTYHVILNAGDYVSVNVRSGYSARIYGGHTTFSGHFLG